METKTLKSGTVVKIQGIPIILNEDVEASGDFATIRNLSPEFDCAERTFGEKCLIVFGAFCVTVFCSAFIALGFVISIHAGLIGTAVTAWVLGSCAIKTVKEKNYE